MRADFIILSSSPLDMAPGKDLPQVLQTYVDGQLMYERQAAAAA
jgi:predicted amidohydrolase YtcJ